MLGTHGKRIGLCVDGRGDQYLASPGGGESGDGDETGNFEFHLNLICGNFERYVI